MLEPKELELLRIKIFDTGGAGQMPEKQLSARRKSPVFIAMFCLITVLAVCSIYFAIKTSKRGHPSQTSATAGMSTKPAAAPALYLQHYAQSNGLVTAA